MQRLGVSGFRAFRFISHPGTRFALRAGRTTALAGTIAYAGYGTGVHDALADPEGTTSKILNCVLVAAGGAKLLPADRPDAKLIQRLGEELVAAAQVSLEAELADLTTAVSKRAAPTSDEEAAMERVKSQQAAMRRTWRFVVIDDATINAFVTDQLPGHVFIHRKCHIMHAPAPLWRGPARSLISRARGLPESSPKRFGSWRELTALPSSVNPPHRWSARANEAQSRAALLHTQP